MGSEGEGSTELEIFFEKTPGFRTLHADGAWGGITGQLGLHLAFYTESREPPQSVTLVSDGATVGEKAESRTGRQAIIRQIEIEVFFSLETAQALSRFLDEKIKEAQRIARESRGGDAL